MPLLALLLMLQVAATPNPLTPITAYNGSWTLTSAHTMAGPGKPDHITNHCHLVDAYLTCEQVVNGKPMALLVFTPTDTPGAFHTQIVLPNGQANGRGDLTIAGNHWTFLGKSTAPDGTTTTFRTENTFTGRDHIHFEQSESTDGTTWKKTGEGDETRDTP